MNMHVEVKTADIKANTTEADILEHVHRRDDLTRIVVVNMKSRAISYIDDFWPYRSGQKFWPFAITVSREVPKKGSQA